MKELKTLLSLEEMLEKGNIVHDFDTTLVTMKPNYERSRIGKFLLKYSESFKALQLSPENPYVSFRTSLLRLRVGSFFIEYFLRDLIKRVSLHLNLLSLSVGEGVQDVRVSRASNLLLEVSLLESKAKALLLLIDEAITSKSQGDLGAVHSLEREYYKLRERAEYKLLWARLLDLKEKLDFCLKEHKLEPSSVEGEWVRKDASESIGLVNSVTDSVERRTLSHYRGKERQKVGKNGFRARLFAGFHPSSAYGIPSHRTDSSIGWSPWQSGT